MQLASACKAAIQLCLHAPLSCLQETQETPHQTSTLNPKWLDTKFDWFKVSGGAPVVCLGKMPFCLLAQIAQGGAASRR